MNSSTYMHNNVLVFAHFKRMSSRQNSYSYYWLFAGRISAVWKSVLYLLWLCNDRYCRPTKQLPRRTNKSHISIMFDFIAALMCDFHYLNVVTILMVCICSALGPLWWLGDTPVGRNYAIEAILCADELSGGKSLSGKCLPYLSWNKVSEMLSLRKGNKVL